MEWSILFRDLWWLSTILSRNCYWWVNFVVLLNRYTEKHESMYYRINTTQSDVITNFLTISTTINEMGKTEYRIYFLWLIIHEWLYFYMVFPKHLSVRKKDHQNIHFKKTHSCTLKFRWRHIEFKYLLIIWCRKNLQMNIHIIMLRLIDHNYSLGTNGLYLQRWCFEGKTCSFRGCSS